MTRLLSFDVGIKNMAYCLLDLSQNEIVEWNVLNLCEQTNGPSSSSTERCNHTLKNGTSCNAVAKYSKNSNYVCAKHAKSSQQYEMPESYPTKSALGKKSPTQLRTLWTNTVGINVITKPEQPKTKGNLITQILDYYERRCWKLLPKPKKTNAGKVDLVTIGRSLHAQMIENPNMKTVDCVIIENQISPIANRMKTIQGMLAQHFISLGVSTIEFVSSSNKLKELAPQSGAKTTYKQHKQDGIFYGEKFLKENFKENQEKWLKYFHESPKKDDLADSFLQALWWCKRGSGQKESASTKKKKAKK